MKKQLSFSNIKLKDLRKVVAIKPITDETVFDKWFNFDYVISKEETHFLRELIANNQLRIATYSEEELKMKFIAPLLNKIDFTFAEVTDWYERPISCQINEVNLGGTTDYLVAKGIDEPELPYFFIQEFKPSRSNGFPEYQLLAELLVALQLNGEKQILGAYILGQLWIFMLLRKEGEQYYYYKSLGFNALKEGDLMAIYRTLQGVRASVLEKVKNEL
ncbi:MAG: hypothetical protein AB8G86_08325 [Saprospiraceae bacterium]